ncbi:hypothetical protein QUF70_03885, partial [Desulfobacterales bacterium HSG17]|nr:hypothetical protein [Desulfobacterales bacterium HSG17]
ATNIYFLIFKDIPKKLFDKINNIINTKEIKNGYWILDGIKDRPSKTPVLRSNEYFSAHIIINLSILLTNINFIENIYNNIYQGVATILKGFNVNYQWVSNSTLVGMVEGDVYQTCLFLRALSTFSKINKQSHVFVCDKINKILMNYDSNISNNENIPAVAKSGEKRTPSPPKTYDIWTNTGKNEATEDEILNYIETKMLSVNANTGSVYKKKSIKSEILKGQKQSFDILECILKNKGRATPAEILNVIDEDSNIKKHKNIMKKVTTPVNRLRKLLKKESIILPNFNIRIYALHESVDFILFKEKSS